MDMHDMKSAGTAQVGEVGAGYGARDSRMGVRRIFNYTQMFFFILSYMSSWEAIITNIGLAFYNGGPRALVWGFFIVIPGIMCQVASIAELASIQPIAGAQYHWTWHLAPPQHRRFITWIQGWITWFAWISLLAGVINISANVTTTIVVANYPNYVVQGWHTILIMYAYLAIFALLNMYVFWIIPWIEVLAGFLHLILWIILATVLLVLAPRHTNSFVFTQKANLSGWNNDFVGFNLGIQLITWGFVGFDSAAHLAEETRRARHTVPRTIFWSMLLNSLLAFAMVVIILACLGPVNDVASSSYPMVAVVLNATGSIPATTAICCGLLLVVIFTSIGSTTSASRLTWAWARDGVLPNYFAHVSPRYRVPIRAVWLPCIIVMLLSLLNLANYTAFSVIVSLSTFGLYQSYFISIACMLSARLSGRIERAPWSLGWAGPYINGFALVYSAWLGLFMIFVSGLPGRRNPWYTQCCMLTDTQPNYLPVTASYYNYALPINVLVWLIALVLWIVWGSKNWRGLDTDIIAKVVADGDRDTKD